MTNYTNLPFHPTMEKVVNILRKRTQNDDTIFFRLMVSYFFSKIASMMRVHVEIADSQRWPVNMYAINLAPSGSGKGHSIAIIEESVIGAFRQRFIDRTFPYISTRNLETLARRRAGKNNTDLDFEIARAEAEFTELGALLFSFDSATSAAIKQMRTKLLMANAGSMNLEIDEVGSNLLGNMEVLDDYLELFDTGKIKPKLVKNTRDNVRSEDLFGCTPTNMLLFGTPTKLLNGSKIEDEFYEMLERGYARRCYFGFARFRKNQQGQTAQDIYDIYTDASTSKYLAKLADTLGLLADPSGFHQTLKMKKDVSLALFDYQIHCVNQANLLSEFEEVRKAEITHRYFKVAKLAAVYAYIDKSIYVTQAHLNNAIAMAEESGQAFSNILNRDRPYIKLANYIASIGKELTHADLVEDLPFYKGTEQQKREMMNLAIAHGYKNGIYIRKEMIDSIEFLSGKSVAKTDTTKIIMSYSTDIVHNYKNDSAPFDKLHILVTRPKYHWVSHALMKGYRNEENCIPGVNLAVIDVENSVSIDTAKLLLKEYKWLIHVTKRHTAQDHRYRILLPLSHVLELDAKDYREFMINIYDWLPFEVDRQTNQRSRKWLTNKGKYWYNDGQLLDSLQFVPKTKKADERKKVVAKQTSLTNLERWFINNTEDGNRNNQLARYAFALIDLGHDMDSIRNNVMALNKKLDNPLPESELLATVIVSASKKIHLKGDPA